MKHFFRVIGITARKDGDGFLVVGAIYKGNEKLDGVTAERGAQPITNLVTKMLKGSKHLGQIRLILLDKDLPELVSAKDLWEQTGKPVLMPLSEAEFDPRYMLEYNGETFLVIGIDEESARRVLDKIYGESGCEALRISGIILRSIPMLHNV